MSRVISSNYGSIPHLSTSKLTQQVDKKIVMGQEEILTKKARDWKDLIIVTEKVDGSNVGVVRTAEWLVPVTRSGYSAISSKYRQHVAFWNWADKHEGLFEWLPVGWRIAGEWCVMAHGTMMDLTGFSPFVAFDVFDQNSDRLPYLKFLELCSRHNIPTTTLIHIGQPISIKNAVSLLGEGVYGKPEKPEGIVYRVERGGRVDFLAKWVRSDKEDGKYMDMEIWNVGAEIYVQPPFFHEQLNEQLKTNQGE